VGGETEKEIMSVSTINVHSEAIKCKGMIVSTVPADEEYRIYMKNHALDDVNFCVKAE